ncbi:MAG: ABC transporter permease [Planctomycetota bacterium]
MSAGAPELRVDARAIAAPRGRLRSRLPWCFAAALLFVVAFAPVLANDVPLCARVDGRWSFPAVVEIWGQAPPSPSGARWKDWRATLPKGSGDFAVFPPWPYGPAETDLSRMRAGPSWGHPMGCDDTGRDVLARLLRGARSTVGLSVLGVLLAGVLGSLLGALAGLRRGAVDWVVLRLVEVFLCFPILLLVLAVAAFYGDSKAGVVVAFALTIWPSFARMVRGSLLSLREREFVRVARHLGVPDRRIVLAHLLPQLRGQIAVVAAFGMAHAVIAESTLSFLGIGPGVQGGSWGGVLAQGKASAHLWVWHLWLFPGALIVATVICCHVIADRLRPRA